MGLTIGVLGTLDTKSVELAFLYQQIRAQGCEGVIIDASAGGQKVNSEAVSGYPVISCVIPDMAVELSSLSRADALAVATEAVSKVVTDLADTGKIQGLVAIGGSGGTELAATVMRSLPFGFPKVLVTTLGSSPSIAGHVDGHDIMVLHAVTDVSGINSITRSIFTQAAGAVTGAAKAVADLKEEVKPRIAASMYGVTTPCVMAAKDYLEKNGYEVVVFHATGIGGKTMEDLIKQGFFCGVLDVTTTELSAEVLGGDDTSGPDRMSNAASLGIPCVVCPGAEDLVFSSDLSRFPGRKQYSHNREPSHFRPNADDNKKVGAYFARQLNNAAGPCAVVIPTKGLSAVGAEDGPLWDPDADLALFSAIEENLDKSKVKLIYMDNNINDPEFALFIARLLKDMIEGV